MSLDASHQVSAQSDLLFGSRCDLQIFKMAAMWPSWISEQNHFSGSKSPCCPNAFYEVSAVSDLQFGSKLKTFKKAAMAAIIVCVEVLLPSQPNGVISSAVSLPNHSFTEQAYSSKWLTSIVQILSPETDNCPSESAEGRE